jgi:hypothetical protein
MESFPNVSTTSGALTGAECAAEVFRHALTTSHQQSGRVKNAKSLLIVVVAGTERLGALKNETANRAALNTFRMFALLNSLEKIR